MTISAINYSGVKPQTSFKSNEQDRFKEFRDYTYYKLQNYNVKPGDIKEPIAIAGTFLLAAVIPYATTKCITTELLSSNAAKKFCYSIEAKIKNKADNFRDGVKRLSETNGGGIIDNVKKYTGKGIGFVENTARNIYKSIAYVGLPADMEKKEKSAKAMANIVAAGAVGAILPDICTKDSDGDGIKDIMQHKHSLLSMLGPSF